MERKIVLEVEELEERIAPHCGTGEWLGGNHAASGFDYDHANQLCTGSNVGHVDLPAEAMDGIATAIQGGN